jgi:hypothetical protein
MEKFKEILLNNVSSHRQKASTLPQLLYRIFSRALIVTMLLQNGTKVAYFKTGFNVPVFEHYDEEDLNFL